MAEAVSAVVPPDIDASPPSPGPIHEAAGWQIPLLWLVGMMVRVWCRTLRVEYDREGMRVAHATPTGVTMMLWHNRLFFVPWLSRVVWAGRPVFALVSASRDGASLAKFFHFLGLQTVRGSSSRFGREALRELIAVQRTGGDIAITPDGPRGPVYSFKAGAVLAARRTRSPLLLFGVHYTGAWRLRSWDGFFIPKPFSRVVLRHELVYPDALPAGQAGVAWVRERLLVLSAESPQQWPIELPASDDAAAG